MTLSADEFIRRFLLHALPDGFHRIRHYGLFANGRRVAKLAQCRLLLAAPTSPSPTADYRERYRCLTGRSLDICPGRGGAMAPFGPLTCDLARHLMTRGASPRLHSPSRRPSQAPRELRALPSNSAVRSSPPTPPLGFNGTPALPPEPQMIPRHPYRQTLQLNRPAQSPRLGHTAEPSIPIASARHPAVQFNQASKRSRPTLGPTHRARDLSEPSRFKAALCGEQQCFAG